MGGSGWNVGMYVSGLSKEERTEQARKAAAASVAARRKYKTMREVLRRVLTLDVDDPRMAEGLKALGLEPSYANAIGLSVIRKAATLGDVEAARFTRDTVGEKPTEALNLGLTSGPVKALDLAKMSDAELEALADRLDLGDDGATERD